MNNNPRIIILVDNKWRDLPGDCLIARLLQRQLDAEVWLEPLGNLKVALAQLRPHMVVFNHTYTTTLTKFAGWLQSHGVKVVVLSNEGIIYHPEVMKWNAGVYYDNSVIDLFLAWNDPHRQALIELGKMPPERVTVVGVPRFDFYFHPYDRALRSRTEVCAELGFDPQKPLLLFTSNFIIARYHGRLDEAEKAFASWKPRISAYERLPEMIEDDYRRRQKWLEWLTVVEQEVPDAQLILKPHPNENQHFYHEAVEHDETLRRSSRVRVVTRANIWELICAANIVITRNCTTAIEGWLRGKPTFDLFLDDKEPFFEPSHAAGSDNVNSVQELVDRIRYYLDGGAVPSHILAHRRRHLLKWCSEWTGRSSQRVVDVLRPVLEEVSEPGLRRGWNDYRRMAKRRLKSLIGMDYSERLSDYLYLRLKGVERLGREDRIARPADIAHWMRRIDAALATETTATAAPGKTTVTPSVAETVSAPQDS